jgi:hypothetical protein
MLKETETKKNCITCTALRAMFPESGIIARFSFYKISPEFFLQRDKRSNGIEIRPLVLREANESVPRTPTIHTQCAYRFVGDIVGEKNCAHLRARSSVTHIHAERTRRCAYARIAHVARIHACARICAFSTGGGPLRRWSASRSFASSIG